MTTSNRHKTWVLRVLSAIAAGVLFHLIIWLCFTQELLQASNHGGDLSRVGYIAGVSYKNKPGYSLPKKHIENYQYQQGPIDMITLGDSFSNGCGKNDPYYQDWIASLHDMNVLNIQALPQMNYLETIETLLRSGYLDLVRPKHILIQIIERNVIEQFASQANLSPTVSLDTILKYYQHITYENNPPQINFINVGNLKFVLYSFLRQFKDNAFFSKVYEKQLSRSLFTVKKSKSLIFMYEDFANISASTAQNVTQVNHNLNQLAGQLRGKGIQLHFMPVVDKYNLYSSEILNNDKPQSTFFETLRKMKKEYHLIDTKEILGKEIQRGEKDIYYADDTHWSGKAPKVIFKNTSFTVSSN